MREYTEKIHAKNLLLNVLDKEKPCDFCPAALCGLYWSESKICKICCDFVGTHGNCPCHSLGKEAAIKRTWLALEEKGYI